MALHTPAHPLGTTHHPHTLRYALFAVIAAIVVVALLVIADVVKLAPASEGVVADKFLTTTMIEFRAGERDLGAAAATVSDPLTTPAMIEFRAGERSLENPGEYNGPH